MSVVYVACASTTPRAVWIGATQHATPLVHTAAIVLEQWQLPNRDMADHVQRLAELRLAQIGIQRDPGGWYSANSDMVREVVRLFYTLTIDPPPADPLVAVMVALRKGVFDCSQTTFAHLAGVSRSLVCRWEKGTAVPDLAAIARLRQHAFLTGLPWPNDFPLAVSDPRTLRVVDGERDANPGQQGSP